MKIPPELLTVAKCLGHLTEKTVFVGGMIRGLLITDPAAGAARPTDDVDLIVDVASYKAFTDLNEELRALGFSESMEEGAPICRWIVAGIRTDIMPIDPGILGFTNVWYSGAMDHPAVIAGPNGKLRILDAPYFCATKLEAFAARGDGDYLHRDLEDFIAIVDGRPTLIDEIASAPVDVRAFVAEVVSGLMATQTFVDILPGHLEGDAGSQARLLLLVGRLQRIAALGPATNAGVPPNTSVQETRLVAPRGSVPEPGVPFSLPSGWVPLRSSNLRAVQYEPETQALTIEFHSRSVYVYSGVPATIFEGLLRAYSAGRYHHRWIRGRYPYRRVRREVVPR
jgi:hypothetical protein